MGAKVYVPDQGNIPHITDIDIHWYQGINNFFTRGGYSDLYLRSRGAPVLNATSATPTILTVDQYNNIITNNGAASDTPITLPIATPGLEYRFRVASPFYIGIHANGSDTIEGGGIGQGIRSNSPVDLLHLVCCVSGLWDIQQAKGTWSIY